jgi:excisionase family DNA binding protein
MSCSTIAANRGLAAKNYVPAMSSINETVGVCLTLKEAAFNLRVCRRTLEREINAGRLRAVKIGRAVRIREYDLKAYVDGLVTHPPQASFP